MAVKKSKPRKIKLSDGVAAQASAAMERNPLFRLELDLHLHYEPLMDEEHDGIVITKTLQLPFPPYEGLALIGKDIDECPAPWGFKLTDVTWDMDRQVFGATTSLTNVDLPLAFMPDDIRAWLDRGWRLGSYTEVYEEPDDQTADAEETSTDDDPADSVETQRYALPFEDDDAENMHTRPPESRSDEFNRFFNAVVRQLAETCNNCDVAYAMDKLGRLRITPKHVMREVKPDPAFEKQWSEALREYGNLSAEKRIAWQQDVLRKHPSLAEAIGARR